MLKRALLSLLITVGLFSAALSLGHFPAIKKSLNVGGGSGTINQLAQLINSKDEGISLTSRTASLDFVGAGVTATNSGNAVTVTIPGGAGSSIIFDIGDDGGNDSTALSEIATSGDTNAIFTEPSADKVLIDLTKDWPKADLADALNANGANCSSGLAPLGVSATGAVESCFDVWTEAENTSAAYISGNQSITLSGDVSGSGTTAITTTIGNDKILESMLKAVDAAVDEECLTKEDTTGDFEWQSCGAGGSESTTVSDTTTINLTLTGSDITADGLYTAGDNLTLTGADFDLDATLTGLTSVSSTTFVGALTGAATDLNCTDCINATEIEDIYMLNSGDTSTGAITINDNGGTGSTLLTIGDANDADSVAIFGDLTISGGDLTFGTSLILSGGDTTSLNLIDAIDGTTETTFESALDIGGDGSGTVAALIVTDDSHAHTSATLSGLDISADTNLTAGDALTLTDDDIDFDGGATPGGELGNTWASPTLDDSVTTTGWVMGTFSGTTFTAGTVNADLFDAVGAVDMDFGSVDITDFAFVTDGTGDAEIVFPDGSIGALEIVTDGVSADELNATGVEAELETALDIAGEVSSTGMASTVIADSIAVSNWILTTPGLSGKVDSDAGAVNDDDCTGEIGWFWFDDTDSAFEFCNADSGVPSVLGGSATPTVITVADTTDATSFCGLFESATGDLGPKTDGGCLYDAGAGSMSLGGDITLLGGDILTGNITFRIGDAATDSITLTTDGTGDGEVVLPDQSISGTEILNATIGTADISGSAGITAAQTALTAGRSLTFSTNDILADAELYTDTKCIYWESPVAGDDFKSIWRPKIAATVTSIWAESDQTVTFMLQRDDGSPGDLDTVDLAPAAGTAEDTALNGDATLAAGDRLDMAVTSVASAPTWASVCWTFTYDD